MLVSSLLYCHVNTKGSNRWLRGYLRATFLPNDFALFYLVRRYTLLLKLHFNAYSSWTPMSQYPRQSRSLIALNLRDYE